MENNPSAPQTRQMTCATFGLDHLASGGIPNATTAATPLYALKPTPTQFAPSLYSAEVVSVVP